jgi:hypothetical protein
MKRIILPMTIFVVSCTPQLPSTFISSSAYDRSIRTYRDHVSDELIYSVQLGSRSDEVLANWSRFTAKMEVLKTTVDGRESYSCRFVLQSSPEEWPIRDEATLLVGKEKYPLRLVHINPRNTAQISGSAMDGNVSISTNELQVLRIETVLPIEAIESIKDNSVVMVVFHSGIVPITFRLDEVNLAKLRALINVRPGK